MRVYGTPVSNILIQIYIKIEMIKFIGEKTLTYTLWFNFILSLKFLFLSFVLW